MIFFNKAFLWNFYSKLTMVLLLHIYSVQLYAAQQGPNGPGTATTSGSTSYNWTNANNALSDNTTAATASIVGKGNLTNTLRLTNFGFAIPSGATINGILVEVRMQGANGKSQDQTIQLRKASGPVGSNKARNKAIWPRKSARYIRFGGSSDLWGTTWSHTDINNASFGIDIVAKSRKETATPRVEYVRITVSYNQTQYYSKSTGDLHTLSTWGTNTNGTGTAPSNFTNDGQVFNLRNRASATLSGNLTISGTGSKLVIGDGSGSINFTIPSGFTYSGLADVSNNATLTLNNTTVPTLGTIARSSNGGSSTIIYGASGSQTVEGRAFHNLTISGSGTKTLAGTASAEQQLTINSGATFSDGGYLFLVEANVQNSGTHSSGIDGSIIMNGTSAQSITGSNGIFGNLEIDNSNGISQSTSVTITGEFILSDGAYSIGNFTLTLNGSTTRTSGTISGGTNSNLSISGSGSLGELQFTTGAQSLNNLTVNRSAGDIAIGTPLNIRNQLTMTSGNIDNGSNSFTLGTSTSSRGTLSRTSGTITGPFTRWFNNATNSGVTGLFPVGTFDDYRPAQIEFTTAPSTGGQLTVQFVTGDPGNMGLPLSESSVDINKAGEAGKWTIAAISLTGGGYTGTFTATGFGGVQDYTTLHLIKRDNSSSNWTLNGSHQSTTGSNSDPVLSRTTMSGFGEYGVGGDESNNPLPVELLFFNASYYNEVITLKWATASETNNDYFILQKSEDGLRWVEVEQIDGAGNASIRRDYEYVLEGFQHYSVYFRLKQVDFDGTVSLLPTIYLNSSASTGDNDFSVFPSLLKGGDKLFFRGWSGKVIVGSLINIKGDKWTLELEDRSFLIPNINPGIYIVIINTPTAVHKQRIIVE